VKIGFRGGEDPLREIKGGGRALRGVLTGGRFTGSRAAVVFVRKGCKEGRKARRVLVNVYAQNIILDIPARLQAMGQKKGKKKRPNERSLP